MQSSLDVNPEAQNHQVRDIDVAGSTNNEVRVQFDDNQETNANEALDTELAPLEDIEMSEDENRNKRFLSFGLGGGNSNAGGSGSGGGSGNFLFDIIRVSQRISNA
ncbi:hypothetical protein PV325_013234 [Microctonus aethiopoides]|nr:hypothetical protein PV325_013234 [Microctonus aethiopoides]